MNSTRRRVRLGSGIIATAAAVALLAGCAGPAGGDRPEGEIHIAVYGSGDVSIEQDTVDRFNETSDVKVILDPLPGGDNYQQKLRTIMGTNSAPDIFFNFGSGSIEEYVDAGLLMPLTEFIEKDPQLESAFLPSVFDGARLDGVPYGIPMRPVQPVFMFYNKDVLAEAGMEPPQTWEELLTDVDILINMGITPIALGGADKWPTLTWFQYMYDRVAGPQLIKDAVAGDTSVWDSDESHQALSELRDLIDRGAFGDSFDSVSFVGGGSGQLMREGRAAFELQGSWNYGSQLTADPDFTANSLGFMPFPAFDGGEGDPGNIVGNPSNYYSVLQATRYPDTVRDFLKLMYSPEVAQAQLATGGLPATTTAAELIPESAAPEFVQFTYDLVAAAPNFQLSWDQAYPTAKATTIHNAVEDFFTGRLDADGFIAVMKSL
ncbi:ABC transporter substrate-binding protein [Glaciibacter superstes]|uniref:ABC transporter substrate-binding protein n=1 Tax=Glaciibacter superstes TaxID=501023 RepID=UPI0003B4DECD|nr:extracellular solute-binding protein [Glaciibacter superstes]